MTRRGFSRALLAAVLAPLLQPLHAHTPYRQWKLLRQRFLLVHSTRTDPRSDELAQQMVDIMTRVLPRANAMAARAPDERRIASLLTTGQAVLAVMQREKAVELYRSSGDFGEFDGRQLRSLVAVEDHLLLTVESFPRHHAWLVTAALVENGGELPIRVAGGATETTHVPVHEGAAAFARGEPLEDQS